jgi:hypothetical protein
VSERPPSPPPPPDDDYGALPHDSQLPPPPPSDSDFAPVRISAAGRTNRYANLSFYLSFFGWLAFGVGALLPVYFGFRALNEIKSTSEDGRNKAVAGIVIGIITLVFFFSGLSQQMK